MKRSYDPSDAPPPSTSVLELVRAPELATLTLLDSALRVARDALRAVHPTLDDELRTPKEDGNVVAVARAVVARMLALQRALSTYRHALRDSLREPERAHDDDLPF